MEVFMSVDGLVRGTCPHTGACRYKLIDVERRDFQPEGGGGGKSRVVQYLQAERVGKRTEPDGTPIVMAVQRGVLHGCLKARSRSLDT